MADKIDERRVREMRELIQEGGAEAVEARYPGGTRSPEYARAVRQRSAARRRAEQARERVVEEHEDRVREQQQMEEKAAAEAERKKADKAQGDERPAAGRHQRDAQTWNSPPAKGKDAHPQRLTGDELEAVRERMREARERIRRDDQAMAARAARAASQGHIHVM